MACHSQQSGFKPEPHWNDLFLRTKVIRLGIYSGCLMILLQGCVLLFLLLCPLSSCPACRPAQQLGWIATTKVELRGVRGDVPSCDATVPVALSSVPAPSWLCPDCHRSLFGRSLVRNYKSLKTGACGPCKQRVQRENCHISRFYSFLYGSTSYRQEGLNSLPLCCKGHHTSV